METIQEMLKYSPAFNSSNDNSIAEYTEEQKEKSQPQSGHITSIKNKNNVTTVQCSIGIDTVIYHDKYGNCGDNFRFGSHDCTVLLKQAEDRCNSR